MAESKEALEKRLLVLHHASQCHIDNCGEDGCKKIKKIVLHAKKCNDHFGCDICQSLIKLCKIHSKDCEDPKCHVMFCLNIRHKEKTKQMKMRLHQARILRLQLANMLGQFGSLDRINHGA